PDPAASPGQMLLELDAQGNVMHRYLWGPAVDQILADEQLQADGTSDMLWPLTDHLGTVRDLARYGRVARPERPRRAWPVGPS
ncbi:MAG: hypothetical protein NUV77_23960, partial [Thermoguttaceae bacterium]|nr:hypothetical protein [Thermoguttaceae bacterium]